MPLPPPAPYTLSALDALAAFRAGTLTPSALLESCLERIAATNGRLNAYVALHPAEALRELARQKDAELQRAIAEGTADTLPALFGLPVGVKDLTETAGLKTTFGSLLFENYVPGSDADIVKRVKEAGGIVVGKSNTPEFGAGANTRNRVYGATGNPFDVQLTTAGSSGGSAALLAAGMSPLALGSDMGGSLRTPSAFCSTIGFRPTPGLIPDMHRKSLLFSPLAVDGPMARTVDDAALLMSVLAREDKRDPLGWEGIVGEAFLPERLPRIELGGLRVGFSEDLGGRVAVDDAVREAFRANLGKLQSLFSAESGGIDVKLEQVFGLPEIPQKSDNVKSMHDVFSVLRAEHFLSNLAARKPENREKLAWPVESNIDIAEGYSYDDRMVAHAHCGLLFARWAKLMEEYDLVILPTASAPPFDKMAMWAPEVVGGKKMANYFEWISITYFITLTQSPVLALPLGSYLPPIDHLPFGIQVVGRRRKDVELFAVGRAMEAALKGRMEPNLD